MAKLTKMALFSKYTMCFTADLHLINILGKNLRGHIISFVLTANGNVVSYSNKNTSRDIERNLFSYSDNNFFMTFTL